MKPVPDPDNDPHLTVHMVDDGGLSYTAFFCNLVMFAVGFGLATALPRRERDLNGWTLCQRSPHD
jgi:hypothetical protein